VSGATRGAFIAGAGSLIVAFSISCSPRKVFEQGASDTHDVDAFLAVDRYGTVTVKFGKVELGTGIATAIAQIVADELDVPFEHVRVPNAQTIGFPDQGSTVGSASLSSGSIPVRQAAAAARLVLLDVAATRFGVSVDRLQTSNGIVTVTGKAQSATYADLLAGQALRGTIAPDTKAKSPDLYRFVGKGIARIDVPAKVYGSFIYLQNLRVAGMLHGRVIRPSAVGASIGDVDTSSIAHLSDTRVVRRGDAFLGVVAPTEWGAIQAMRALKVTWRGGGIPQAKDLAAAVRAVPAVSTTQLTAVGDAESLSANALRATYVWPYQTHGSIGPSCAVADVRKGSATVWSASQGIFVLRAALAQLLQFPDETVEVRYVEAAGCYGHNGADDAAADAALLSQAVGKPVRVQWMREQEHGWDPKGPAMVMTHAATLDDNKARVASWTTEVWSPSHTARPDGGAGNLLAGELVGVEPASLRFVGGSSNAKADYVIPNYRVTIYNLQRGVLRSSSMRGLGATQNTFSTESFMDELAHAAGADPLAFRRAHLVDDPRALELLAAIEKLSIWKAKPSASNVASQAPQMHGRGLAFVHFDNSAAYVSAVADVTVTRASGVVSVRKIAIAHDCGLVVNPDGLRNQIEGNAIQAMSRSLKEQVTYNTQAVTSIDWQTYPIARFSDVPQIDITLVNRIHEPIAGAGEAATTVIAPAINNAIFDATGVRLREIPFTPDRVKAALTA
jgi:CO/xanthine dehydrogenase Mo-binding subunit